MRERGSHRNNLPCTGWATKELTEKDNDTREELTKAAWAHSPHSNTSHRSAMNLALY
jgi:hypothetical protein